MSCRPFLRQRRYFTCNPDNFSDTFSANLLLVSISYFCLDNTYYTQIHKFNAHSCATGSASCTACSAGSFAAGLENTQCTLCPAGSISESEGADKCVDCGAGTIAEVEGYSVDQSLKSIIRIIQWRY